MGLSPAWPSGPSRRRLLVRRATQPRGSGSCPRQRNVPRSARCACRCLWRLARSTACRRDRTERCRSARRSRGGRRSLRSRDVVRSRDPSRLSSAPVDPSGWPRRASHGGCSRRDCVFSVGGHWKGLDDLEIATCGWVSWFNDERLHGELDDLTQPTPTTVTNLSPPRHEKTKPTSLRQTQADSEDPDVASEQVDVRSRSAGPSNAQ